MSAEKKPIILLDGGNGQELVHRSHQKPTPLWSLDVMMDTPEIVVALHSDYIKAGARVITLNNYTATPERLERAGKLDAFTAIHQRAGEVAVNSRESTNIDGVAIAGCLPPLVASYRPDVALDYDASLASYRLLVEAQADYVDVFLCETMASTIETRAAITAAKQSGLPVWVAATVEDNLSGLIRSQEPWAPFLSMLDTNGVDALMLNCSKPEAINAAWPNIQGAGIPIGAYANGFTSIAALDPGGTVEALEARDDLTPERYTEHALGWVTNGATIVGGCCEVSPAHIKHLSDALIAAGHTVHGDVKATIEN